jgi:hypothetical protein
MVDKALAHPKYPKKTNNKNSHKESIEPLKAEMSMKNAPTVKGSAKSI